MTIQVLRCFSKFTVITYISIIKFSDSLFRQFSEIFRLLLEIKKQKKKLLMLKYQLHCEEVKQGCGVLDDMLQKESGESRHATVLEKIGCNLVHCSKPQ